MDETRSKPTHSSDPKLDLLRDWYAVAFSRDVKAAPTAALIGDIPIVLFRDATNAPVAFVDRCPHRNVPLSLGRRNGEWLECAYHGWSFDAEGVCRKVPGLCRAPEHPSRRATVFPTTEAHGLIWVCPHEGVNPGHMPFPIPHADAPRYMTVRQQVDMHAPLDAVAENALDVPHTAFLHGGLFRRPSQKHEIEVVVRRSRDRVEAEFIGEPRPPGVIGRMLAPKGGILTHTDRFVLPCVAQVEYQLGETHLITTAALTPIATDRTRMFATVCLKLPAIAVPFAPAIRSVAMRIVRQDAVVLDHQTTAVERFGGEVFTSTEIDFLGPQIKKLLRDAFDNKLTDDAHERRVKLKV